jgi:hypothetical protein
LPVGWQSLSARFASLKLWRQGLNRKAVLRLLRLLRLLRFVHLDDERGWKRWRPASALHLVDHISASPCISLP